MSYLIWLRFRKIFIPHFSTITSLPNSSIDFMTNNNQIYRQGIDQPNTRISVTGGSIIFDSEENERPPWTIACCCDEGNCERSLLVLVLHYGVVLLVGTTSIVFFIFIHKEIRSSIGVIAILAACFGYINPSPRQWTKSEKLIFTAFLWSLVPVVREKLI